jgi:hypothetical protein
VDRHQPEHWTGIMLESWTGFAGMRRREQMGSKWVEWWAVLGSNQ